MYMTLVYVVLFGVVWLAALQVSGSFLVATGVVAALLLHVLK